MTSLLRPRQLLGKFRIEKRLAEGGFAEVYRAFDTIEGVRVALKVAYPHLVDKHLLDVFRHEVRVTAQLDHPNILPIKNAEFIGSHFVMVSPLGLCTLGDRLRRRLAVKAGLDYAEQMLEALACAHRRRVIHCDIKPDNFILFPGNRLRLADFGIARVVLHTVSASGSGTIGYIAPEQAMGKPTFRSDVFSLGLVLYRMFSGKLPEWPFERPFPGIERVREKLHPDIVALIDRAMSVDPKQRFENADRMLTLFAKLKPRALRPRRAGRRRRAAAPPREDWSEIRQRQFLRQFRSVLEVHGECSKCEGPVAESMTFCCWCGETISRYRGRLRFKRQCSRCRRSLKSDWRFCPWCYGPSLRDASARSYEDRRYSARCHNPSCERKLLMPFMRYCPWCRQKVRRKWAIPDVGTKCARCGWGVLGSFWEYCPWCGVGL